MMKRCFTVAALVCSVLAVTAHACLWDRDTLAAEARGLPGITEIITGRFDRFPPLFYEMRLERVIAELANDADALELYDDAGVASDRLGRSDEAIAWMERKLGVMDRLEASGVDVGEHRYRYLANLGTFHIHRWLKSGADREDMADVERSRELIAAAIELNPEAHFGRERYQLLAIEWVLNGIGIEFRTSILTMIELANSDAHFDPVFAPRKKLSELGFNDAPLSLAGLISLGNAWESIDVFTALQYALHDQGDGVLGMLCGLRIKELIDNGNKSLDPEFNYSKYLDGRFGGIVPDKHNRSVKRYFSVARVQAQNWIDGRNSYMNERLVTGIHPDTHVGFWDDWEEMAPAPGLPGIRPFENPIVFFFAAITVFLLFGFLIYRVILNRSSRAV